MHVILLTLIFIVSFGLEVTDTHAVAVWVGPIYHSPSAYHYDNSVVGQQHKRRYYRTDIYPTHPYQQYPIPQHLHHFPIILLHRL